MSSCGNLQEGMTDDRGKVNLRTLDVVVNQIGHLENEIIPLSCGEKVIGEYPIQELDQGFTHPVRELDALVHVL